MIWKIRCQLDTCSRVVPESAFSIVFSRRIRTIFSSNVCAYLIFQAATLRRRCVSDEDQV
jgi:hypothetical protein